MVWVGHTPQGDGVPKLNYDYSQVKQELEAYDAALVQVAKVKVKSDDGKTDTVRYTYLLSELRFGAADVGMSFWMKTMSTAERDANVN